MTWNDINNRVLFKGYSDSYFDRVNIFDWNGKFIKRLILDKPVYCFSISRDDSYLYGSSVDLTREDQPEQVLRFELFIKK